MPLPANRWRAAETTDLRLLLVEDDRLLADGVAADLRAAGYAVDIATDGIDGEYLGREPIYDAVVLDLGLPGKPGLEVLEAWRRDGVTTPVLILTARNSWMERVGGLRAGGDDYLGKPFHVEELIARIEALVRRHAGRASALLAVGGVQLDEERQIVRLADGAEWPLTGTEFRLLRYMMMHADAVLSKGRLTEHIYEEDRDRDSNVLEVYIRRLRDKIGRQRIETRRGQGYRFRSRI